MGFPRQENWSGLPFPSPGDLPNPGIKPRSPAWQADSLPLSHLGRSFCLYLLPLLAFSTSLVAQSVKNLPAMQETWVWSPGWEDPLEKEMATRSSMLAPRLSWTEEPGKLQSMGSQKVGHLWVTSTFTLALTFRLIYFELTFECSVW